VKKDLRFICYTYMREKSCKVDYEVLSDALTVSIGMVLPYLVKETEQEVKSDLLKMMELAYHANGSVRGMMAVTEEDIQWMSERYDYYCGLVGDKTKQFVIPQGCIAAMHLHQVRNDAKLVYRALHHCNGEEKVEPILFQFTGILSNIACVLAIYVNDLNGVEEIPFHTKSYILK
jgi:cob(I)alamin adenosyltransferase